jgi:hypothetical protein
LRIAHAGKQHLALHPALEDVGVGQQRAFGGNLLDLPISASWAFTRSTTWALVQPSGTVTLWITARPERRMDSTWEMLASAGNSYSPALRGPARERVR